MATPREKAIKALEKRLKKQPGSPLFARLADYYLEDGRTDDALHVCKEGVAHHPYYTTGHLLKGRALVALGKTGEARKAFHTIHELLPGIEAIEKMLAEVGGPIEVEAPPAPAVKVEEPFVPQTEAPPEPVAVQQQPAPDAGDLTPEANFAPVAEQEPPVAAMPPAEETQEEFVSRMRQEFGGTENTLSLEDYLSGNTASPPSNDIEDLAGKLQGAKITPVIDLSRPAENSPGGSTGFVTPTLAEIYVKQGWYDDAIKAYKALAASKPEESAAHEQRIAEIEEMKKQQG